MKQKFGKAPTFMRADNGKELINDEIIKFCREEGITIKSTALYSSSQNGIAERFNRTLIELVRAMLITKKLPTFLWDEAISHIGTLRCAKWFHSWNGHTVLKTTDSQNAGSPGMALAIMGNTYYAVPYI